MNDMALEYAPHRFTVEEYHRMAVAGVFAPEAHIELLDGELVERLVSMKPPHASAVAILDELLRGAVMGRALVRCQLPITLGDFSEPEPDFAIVSGQHSLYKLRHPYAADILAVVEVSDTSRDVDIKRKIPIYAAANIPETWIVDLIDECVRIFRNPTNREYQDRTLATGSDRIALQAFPDADVSFRTLF